MQSKIIILLCFCLSTPTIAAPILYTYSGNFSGSLAGTSFSGQPTTIIGVGDTNKVTATYNGALLTNQLSAIYVNVASVGSAVFLGYNDIFYTDLGPGLAVNGTSINSGFDFFDSEYSIGANYDLASNIGPVPVTLISGGFGEVNTTVGKLVLSGSTSITFTASVSEPGSLSIIFCGIAGLISYRLRIKYLRSQFCAT